VRTVIDTFARFRILVIAVAAVIMVAGVATLPRLHADILPETSPVTVDVQIEALGLSAPEVEQLVTIPLEKNLFEGILGVSDTTSDTVPGMTDIELHFAPGTDLYHARQLVQERLNAAFILPNVSTPPTMVQPTSTTSDTILVGLTSGTQSIIDLSVLARWTIVPKLLGLDGVTNVSTFGQADRQLQVQVDPAKMEAKHVTLAQVIATAGNSQLVSPITYLQGSVPGTGGYLEGANQRMDIRHILPFGTPGDLAGLPITDAPAGTTLSSVASIVTGHQPLIGNAQVHGTPGLVLVIQKAPGASVPAVTSEVKEALAELAPGMPGVTVDTSMFQQGTYAATAFSNLRTYAIIAAVLAALALLLLLLSLRTAFVAVVSVAMSLALAILVLYQLGYSVNALLLLGLLLALGLVVADASGGGYRRGMGAGLIVTVLTAVPLLVASGTTATFLRPMVVAFAVTAAASILVAATVSVALTSLLASVGPQSPPRGITAMRASLSSEYARSLRVVARVPALLMAVTVVAGIAVLAGIPFLHPGQPAFADRNLVIHWSGAPGMSLTELNRVAGVANRELLAVPGVQDVGATLGRAVTGDQIGGANSGDIWVTMKPDADYAATLTAVKAVADGTPGISGTVSTYESDAMGRVLAAPPGGVVTRIYGTDYAQLEKVAGQVKTIMSGVNGVQGAQVQLPTQQPTLDVEVNLDAAARNGVAPGDIRREAGTLIEGLTVGNFFQDQKVFDVVVQGQADVRSSVQDVQNLVLDTAPGKHVRLGDVASVTVANQPVDIRHENTSLYVDVTANVSGRSASAVTADITSGLTSVVLPHGYNTTVLSGAQLDATTHAGATPGGTVVPGTSFPSFLAYILAALLGIFLIIQAALGSWRLALLAFGTIPLAMGGAMLVIYLGGWAGSLGAVAGLIAVFALAARMAITVMAQIREGHADMPAAAAASSGNVLTTLLVSAAALAPFALSRGTAGLELLWPASCVILGGLATIALASLYILPGACLALGPGVVGPRPEAADEGLVPPQREHATAHEATV
jgi:Cu/Ag efflux pump CusA